MKSRPGRPEAPTDGGVVPIVATRVAQAGAWAGGGAWIEQGSGTMEESQLAATDRLHALATRLVAADELPAILEEVLDATIALQGADLGNIQLYDPETESLTIAVQRGFAPEFLEHFRVVDARDASACGRALRSRERIMIEDVEEDPEYAPHRAVAAAAGYRGVQSTPIFARDGSPIGMLSTHFAEPHRPSAQELRLTDVYLRMAADLIGRARSEAALRQARDEAERASEAKGQFLSTMSHELRTPLTAVIGFAELLRSEMAGPVNPVQKKHLARIGASAWHLVSIIDEILTFSRSEAGRAELRLADVDVAELARGVADMLAPQAEGHGLALRVAGVDAPVRARTDAGKLRQILVNLLGNAIRYTQEGVIELEVAADASRVEMVVRDTGVGIAPEKLEEIFEPFVQGEASRRRGKGGTGLGLAICRRLATLLEGDVSVASTPGVGSTFRVRLPREGPAA